MEAAQASPSLHFSKCHTVGNHMSGLITILFWIVFILFSSCNRSILKLWLSSYNFGDSSNKCHQ